MRYLVLSPSGLNTIQLCGRRYFYEKVMRLVPMHKAEALEKGDLMHKVLETHYTMLKDVVAGEAKTPYAEIIAASVDMGRRYSVNMDIPPAESEAVIKQYQVYAVYYKDDPWEPLAVEQKFSKPVYRREDAYDGNCVLCVENSRLLAKEAACEIHEGLTIILEGKIDLVARHRVNGQVYIWDHKTGSRRVNPSKLSNQFISYAVGVNQFNVVLNQIGFQKTLEPKDRFHRAMMSYPQALIEEWRDNLIFWAELIAQFQRAGHYPMNWTSCDKYGGCIFKDVCASHPGARQSKLVQNFVVKDHSLYEESLVEEE